MKNNNRATSLVEVLVSMVILVLWITWTYNIYFRTMYLSESSKNRLTAIEMAREWIEAVTNIRDTNWLNYWADYKNCWNVLNYNVSCVNNNTTTNDILAWSYILGRNPDNKWILTTKTAWVYSTKTYRDEFQVGLDTNWFYTQNPSWSAINWPLFSREIKITYPEDTNSNWSIDSNDEKMQIKSLVQWIDSSTTKVQKIEFETILSNWKNKIN